MFYSPCLQSHIPILAIGIIFSALNIEKLWVDTSVESFMVIGDPDIEYYNNMIEIFGSDTLMIVYVEDENLFSVEKLKKLEAETRACYALQRAIRDQIHDPRCHLRSSPEHRVWLKIQDGVRHVAHKRPGTLNQARRFLAEAIRDNQRDARKLTTEIYEIHSRITKLKEFI